MGSKDILNFLRGSNSCVETIDTEKAFYVVCTKSLFCMLWFDID